jgi:signal transduction histidine kinase
MSDPQADPKWHRLLSLSVHEFRTPITVVAGYIRMLLKDRAGALNDQQRRLLEEAEKSCGRLSALVAEMSELSSLEAGSSTFNRSNIDVATVLDEAIAALPPLPDREIAIQVSSGGPAIVSGDTARLKSAFASVVTALRRELVTSNQFHVRSAPRQQDGKPVVWIAFGDSDQIDRLSNADPSALSIFDEWRGGCGLSLAIARRVIGAHDGTIWSAGDDAKAGAVVILPGLTSN